MFEYYTVAVISILGAMSPGLDFAIVLRNVLAYHRRAGIFTAFGIGAGIIFHATYCVLGLALVISKSMLLFTVIRSLGGAYLIYLGVRSLLDRKKLVINQGNDTSGASISDWRAFRDGLFVNALNPKVTVFMLSIFSLLVGPTTPWLVQFSYGAEMALIGVAWFVFLSYALSLNWFKSKLVKSQTMISYAMGIILIGIGVFILWESVYHL